MRWPPDNQAALIRFYGNPGNGEVERQLVPVMSPFQFYYGKKPITLRFHKKAVGALESALKEIWDHYDHDQSKLDALGISKTGGTFNPRKVRGSATKWSNHAFGAAIDIDPDHNGFNTGRGRMPAPVIAAFDRQGFRWGGRYNHRTDPMHFEACDPGEVMAPLTLLGDTDGHSDGPDPDGSSGNIPIAGGEVKGLIRSKIAWLTGGLGGTSVISTLSSDPSTTDLLHHLVESPNFWLAAAAIGFAGLAIYYRWKDHGRGHEPL